MKSLLDLLDLAGTAAEAAGEYLRAARGSAGWEAKGHNDWVSAVDREAEARIAGVLLEGLRGSRILGEELTPEAALAGPVWIVDPLDGTANYLHGYPQYAVSIALAVDGKLTVGAVLDVEREALYGAMRGGGAWLRSGRLQVSGIADPARALLGTGYPFKRLGELDRYLAQFRALLPQVSGIRRAGAAALDLADVAAGRFDGFWELVLAPWDIAAGILLVREAGGVVTDLAGRAIGPEHSSVVAGNPAMHRWLLDQLQGA